MSVFGTKRVEFLVRETYSFRIHETPRSRMTFRSRWVSVALGLV